MENIEETLNKVTSLEIVRTFNISRKQLYVLNMNKVRLQMI